jgi:hypothetical protein
MVLPIGLIPGFSAWADLTDAPPARQPAIANLPGVCDWKYGPLQWTIATLLLENKSPRNLNKIK